MNLMKLNVWLLSACQALLNSGNSLLITTSALVSLRLSPDKTLATLPLALQYFTSMVTTFPAAMVMKRIGRRAGFVIGSLLGMLGAGLAAYGVVADNFVYFCLAAVLIGSFNGFGTFYRFAAADVATPDYRSRAISYVIAGGVIAAVIGPNLANWTKNWLSGVEFAGSYLGLLGLYGLSLAALGFVHIPPPSEVLAKTTGRPLWVIVRQPKYLVALIGATLGFGVMAVVMMATTLAMRHYGHPFTTAALVIEWHLVGMFAPSFFTGGLIQRFGVVKIMLSGVILYVLSVTINLAGTSTSHFWFALTSLGIGWNFLYVGATALLTETYTAAEKAKAEALNDFLVFTVIAASSFSAGALQYHYGWRSVNLGTIPLIAIIFISLLWLQRRRQDSS